MADKLFFTKFSGEVMATCRLGVTSYEVWVNNKFFMSADSYAKALAFLSDYLHTVAQDELSKHILETELMKQTCTPYLSSENKK